MTTIKDIAARAHVTAATVSNVLNGKGGASEAKAQEIRRIAAELHYTPNLIAKNLKKQHSNTIGIITEDLTSFNTPEIVDGIDACCEERGYETLLGNMRMYQRFSNDFSDVKEHQRRLDAVMQNMLSKQVEGIVYVGYHVFGRRYMPKDCRLPLVYAYSYPEQARYPSVLPDDEQAARTCTELLLCKGHRRIGLMCGPADSPHTLARIKGVRGALHDKGVGLDPEMVVYGDWDFETGRQGAGRLLHAGATAIFAFNDIMAGGVYAYCAAHHLTVGRQVSVLGFDNRGLTNCYVPALTTVALPLTQIGRESARMILDALQKREQLQPQRVLLPCQIVERESVAEIAVAP